MPRLGELCDARDDLRQAVLSIQERTTATEVELDRLKNASLGVAPMNSLFALAIGESTT